MQTGEFYVIKTDKGYLLPWKEGTWGYEWTPDIHSALRYKTVPGTRDAILGIIEDEVIGVTIIKIKTVYEEDDVFNLHDVFLKDINKYKKLRESVDNDVDELDRKPWKQFLELNENLGMLGVIEPWKRTCIKNKS